MPHIRLNGREYAFIESMYSREFLQVVRQQADNGQEPSEFSLNPNDLWRRSQDDWFLGDGQEVLDSSESSRNRSRTSSGMNHFGLRRRIGLAFDGVVDTALPTSDNHLVLADNKMWFLVASNEVGYSTDGTTVDTITPTTEDIVDITSDGVNLYLATNDGAGSGGVYIIGAGATSATLLNLLVPDKIAYVSGRLMCSAGADLYNITDAGSTAIPTALTSDSIATDFQWNAFGSGGGFIFAAGNSGDLSQIYRITLQEDGTALTAPVASTQMPDSEIVYAIDTYLGVVVLGTSKGIRLGTLQSGAIDFGPLVDEVSDGVKHLEPQGRYLYYNSFRAVRRLDLSRFIEGLTLVAAASDYCTLTVQFGQVGDIVTYNGSLFFLAGELYKATETLFTRATATLDTGLITYRMPDKKQLMFLDMDSIITGDDTITWEIYTEQDVLLKTGQLDAQNQLVSAPINEQVDVFYIKFTFISADGTTSPYLSRWTTRVFPAPRRTEQVRIALDLSTHARDPGGQVEFTNTVDEMHRLGHLVREGTPVQYEEFGFRHTVTLENVQYGGDLTMNYDYKQLEGLAIVTLRIYGDT